MAFVSDGWKIVISLVDNGGDKTTKTYQTDAADAAEAATALTAVLAALGGVTDATVVSYYTAEVLANDSLVYPVSGVENQNQALLTFSIDGNPLKSATDAIPAAKPGIFQSVIGPQAKIVDVGDAAVIAYRSLFQAAGPLYISDGEKVDSLLYGKRRHLKSRNG